MTNPSELVGDEMRAPTAEEVKFYAWRGPGYWGPRDQVNTDMVMMAREVERLREAADTIDRLTSSGEAVAYRTDIFENLPNGKLTRLILDAAEVKDPDPDWKPLFYASPREGHVEVPVELTEAETLLSLIREEAAKSNEPVGRSDSIALYNIRAALGLPRYGAALPNQGETKP